MKSQATVVAQLRLIQEWLRAQTTYTEKNNAAVRDVVAACVYLLSQSVRSYKQWVAANRSRVRGKYTSPANNKAIRGLIELAITDMEACSWKRYLPPWQLDDWPVRGSVKVCPGCGNGHLGKGAACSLDCRPYSKKVGLAA